MLDFVESLIDKIVSGKELPKVQVERQIGPLIDMFIEEIISSKISGEFNLIATEFPIETETKKQNQLATNIDYLLFDKNRKHLLFVELKTDSKSFKRSQFEIYDEVIDKIRKDSANFLRTFLSRLNNKKYRAYINDIDLLIPQEIWSEINSASIVYIAPRKIKDRKWGKTNREVIEKKINFIHFEDMPDNTQLFPKEWEIIRSKLIELDNN